MTIEYIPVHIPSGPIYDIFRDPKGKIHVISPPPPQHREINEVLDIRLYQENGSDLKFEPIIDKHGNTRRYTLYDHDLHVSITEITLIIRGNKIKTRINIAPKFKDEIVLNTICKDREEWFTTWAEHHLNIGVDRIILYDNSKSNKLRDSIKPLIEAGLLFYIKWPYPYKCGTLKTNGLRRSCLSGQTTSQNHALNLLSECRIIGNLDVDEFINLQKFKNVGDLFDKYIERGEHHIRMPSRTFFNSSDKPHDGKKFFKIFECNETIESHNGKQFIHPDPGTPIPTISVHEITDGSECIEMDPTDAYFNHYIYLSNTNMDRRSYTNLTTDKSMLDT